MYGFSVYNGAFLGTSQHSRSVSLGPPPQPPPHRGSISKAKSTNTLRAMAERDAATLASRSQADTSFHTIQDPRMASTSDLSTTGSNSSRPADAKDEMTVLNDKLISAINHQQTLDDNLSQTRHELETLKAKAAKWEAMAREYEAKVTSGDLMSRDDVTKLHDNISRELAETKKQKDLAQQEKRGMEAELENLTASLFDEANKMVSTANQDRDATEKKNQQLRDQIKDGEAVITSQTEQLTELKTLMQHSIVNDHRKELSDSPKSSIGPSSPAIGRDDMHFARLMEAMNLSPVAADDGSIAPSPSTQLTHLIRPQCRTDIPTYDDFKSLLQNTNFRSHNPSHASSRAGSGSYGALSGLGLGSLTNSGNNSSNPNLTSQHVGSSKLANSPQLPGSFMPTTDVKGPTPLKETKFFKRIMFEDVEPTLRLDLSPTISWLNRRSILAAVGDSTLIVEPIAEASQKLHGKYTACAVCGEYRKEGQNPRTHAMRVKEGEGASKWAICQLCLEKVRGVCDLIGYVRMVRDGVVKVVDKKDEDEVWEEIIKFRERLFWARMAGGVVPAFLPSKQNSPAALKPADRADSVEKDNERGFITPQQSRGGSPAGREQGSKSDAEAELQLQAGLDGSLTTFANAKEQVLKQASLQASPASPPATPARNREAGGYPRISIPKVPSTFWESQINTLH